MLTVLHVYVRLLRGLTKSQAVTGVTDMRDPHHSSARFRSYRGRYRLYHLYDRERVSLNRAK